MLAPRHLPLLWKFRLLRAIHARGTSENRRLLDAWAKAEGGTADYNPLNTTQPWPGATPYNWHVVGGKRVPLVLNYPTAAAGIAATAATLVNGHYPGIVRDLRAGKLTARQIASRNLAELDTWGTGGAHVLALL